MRGDDQQLQTGMFSYVALEDRIPADHPLRGVRKLGERLTPRLPGREVGGRRRHDWQLDFQLPALHTRLTHGFSKKIENHAAMVAIHAVYYNFGRIHKMLRIRPTMAAGLADHVWSLEEIALLAN